MLSRTTRKLQKERNDAFLEILSVLFLLDAISILLNSPVNYLNGELRSDVALFTF